MNGRKPQAAGSQPYIVKAYLTRWGRLPQWLDELPTADRTRVLAVSVRLGMPLAATDWHLLEDQQRPDRPSVRKKRPMPPE